MKCFATINFDWYEQDVPGWMQAEGSLGSSSGTSMNSMSVSMTSMGSTLPSPSQQDAFELDTTCSEALEESWVSAFLCAFLILKIA